MTIFGRILRLAPVVLLGMSAGCLNLVDTPDRFERVIGSKGHTSGRFNKPRGITWHERSDSFYVLDWDGRIQRFTLDGKFRASWIMPDIKKGKPEDIAVTREGNLVIADTHYHRVVEFTTAGDLVRMFGSFGREPGQFIYPVGIATDPEGCIYVSEYGENDRIQKFDPAGEFITEWGSFGVEPGQFRRPSGIDFGPDGNLYVADAVNHRIQVFDKQGKLLKVMGRLGEQPGAFKYPYDVAATESGIYVLEYGNHRIQKLDFDGNPAGFFGRAGRDDGCFDSPWRLTVAAGALYTSDTLNHRVVRIAAF